jgi:tritrans,polycis-undecaprenyl-diphosphate synthase [geranylgeranyl-diphosphate specific]
LAPQNIIGDIRDAALGYLLRPVYSLYAWRLEKQISAKQMPSHIGFILDGNRRWARSRNVPSALGHRMGYHKAKEVLDWCWKQKINTVTVYALSLDNIQKRSPSEVAGLISLVEQAVQELTEDERIRKEVRVKIIGSRDVLPPSLLEKVVQLENLTASNSMFNLFMAVGYSGRAEIVDAIKKIVREAREGKLTENELNEQTVSAYLYTAGAEDPDLILRTGGETRLSDFLPWQAIYSEFVFIDVPWPEFRFIDFLRAIRTYQQKERRKGG